MILRANTRRLPLRGIVQRLLFLRLRNCILSFRFIKLQHKTTSHSALQTLKWDIVCPNFIVCTLLTHYVCFNKMLNIWWALANGCQNIFTTFSLLSFFDLVFTDFISKTKAKWIQQPNIKFSGFFFFWFPFKKQGVSQYIVAEVLLVFLRFA